MKLAARSGKGEGAGLVENGFEIVFSVLPPLQCALLADQLSALYDQKQSSAANRLGGLRNLLRDVPGVAELARSESLKGIVGDRPDADAFPVRAIFFDKTPQANWSVPWHQDLTIAVTERIEAPGFNGWSTKHGVLHVQPPVAILESMITLRLHLDPCAADNGALKVIPGSHRHGKLESPAISEWAKQPVRTCEIEAGGALLMRPLLLHASSQATSPRHRRVLHIEYATTELPGGLRWFVS
jgi:hypothetical protein